MILSVMAPYKASESDDFRNRFTSFAFDYVLCFRMTKFSLIRIRNYERNLGSFYARYFPDKVS